MIRKIAPIVLLTCVALLVGCNMNKKKDSSTTPMKSTALDIPSTTPPAAPPGQYTPPPQPVVYDPPAPQQPVIGEAAVADASDNAYGAPASQTPSRKISGGGGNSARPARASATGGSKYTIKKGDSLWSIAVAKYGNGNKWKQIAAANPKIDPNHVRAGQTITLP